LAIAYGMYEVLFFSKLVKITVSELELQVYKQCDRFVKSKLLLIFLPQICKPHIRYIYYHHKEINFMGCIGFTGVLFRNYDCIYHFKACASRINWGKPERALVLSVSHGSYIRCVHKNFLQKVESPTLGG